MPKTIFISAGEASGEHYGALLLNAIQARLKTAGLPDASFFGMGGARMEAAGLRRVVNAEEMAVMGVSEVVRHLPHIFKQFRKLKKAIEAERPSVAILIDYPDFNFWLAEVFHRLKIPVIFFVSPQLWAWKKGRIRKVQRFVDRMMVIFPFEEPFYRERGVDAEFVGHPLADLPLPAASREDFARENGLDPAANWIGLLPGSRIKEIRALLPTMVQAASMLAASATQAGQSSLQFVLPLASTLSEAQRLRVRQLLAGEAPQLSIALVNDARAALHHARASIVASGTATVEAALIGNPFVVVYRVSRLTYAVARRLVKVPHVAMANLIAAKRVVPELIQDDFTPEKIVQQIGPLLPDGPARESMMKELAQIRGLLRPRRAPGDRIQTAIERVAEVAVELSLPEMDKAELSATAF